jgi:hypothetical protein
LCQYHAVFIVIAMSFPQCEDIAKKSHLWSRKQTHSRHGLWCLGHGLQASRILRNKFLLFTSYLISDTYFYTSWNQLKQLYISFSYNVYMCL